MTHDEITGWFGVVGFFVLFFFVVAPIGCWINDRLYRRAFRRSLDKP